MKLFCTHFQEPESVIGGKNTRIATLSLRHLSIKIKYSIFAVYSEFVFDTTSVHTGYSLLIGGKTGQFGAYEFREAADYCWT